MILSPADVVAAFYSSGVNDFYPEKLLNQTRPVVISVTDTTKRLRATPNEGRGVSDAMA
jgi:hypothetical protein